jgi:hypothetical protein
MGIREVRLGSTFARINAKKNLDFNSGCKKKKDSLCSFFFRVVFLETALWGCGARFFQKPHLSPVFDSVPHERSRGRSRCSGKLTQLAKFIEWCTRYTAALGYSAPDYSVTLHGLHNFKYIQCQLLKLPPREPGRGGRCSCSLRLQVGVNLEVGTKAYLDSSAFIKSKINNAGEP